MEPALSVEIQHVHGDIFAEAAFPIVYAAPVGVSRLRYAPLDTTTGRAGGVHPYETNVVSTALRFARHDHGAGGGGVSPRRSHLPTK